MTSSVPAPSNREEVIIHYQYLRAHHQRRHDSLANRVGNAVKGLAATVAFILLETYRSFHGGRNAWLLPIGFAAIAALVWYSLRLQTRLAREQRLLIFYDRNLSRADGSEPQSGRTGLEPGQELRPATHLYERDLDILGPDSLFGHLATVRTGLGERGLARYLLEPASHEETVQRQDSVKELLPQNKLREEIALLGASRFHEISASFFDAWLDNTPPIIHPAYRISLAITAALNIAFLIAGFSHFRPWGDILPNLALTLCIQAAISLVLRGRVMPLLEASARLHQHVRLIADGLALMQAKSFTTPKLKELQRLSREPASATKLLKTLEGQLTIVEQRTKEWFLFLSLLTAAGTQAAISIAKWKRNHAAAMRQWLAAWAEFEALNALATYAFEHPAGDGQHTWPELLPPSHSPLYKARTLRHPILANAVPNDISLSTRNEPDPQEETETRFYLISGSNMAGKSTLLRAIGVNAVLAYAGAPVRAQSLRLTPLTLGASLALIDSLAEGRSKFLAEVERLSAIVRASASAPLLFLVDEIFSGTNSEDRRTAARAVLEKLLAHGAIGALSTHDLALTDLATPDNTGLNVHMASPDPADPLAFDYILKPGINTASSAQAILRLIGL
jgi:DNA mismatch repair ATPase MutS